MARIATVSTFGWIWTTGFQLHALEVRTDQKTISLLDNPAVQFARKRIAEIRVPFAALGSKLSRFQLAIGKSKLPMLEI